VLSCIFPGFIFGMLVVSNFIPVYVIFRYDLMLLACIGMQVFMLKSGMETKDEILVICLFHVLGLAMELFKVSRGSWSYPEYAYTKFFNVPLYSGFMYASVASFMCQAWRRFDLKIEHAPHRIVSIGLAAAIYLNFFTHHFIYDFRYLLAGLVFLAFYRTKVYFTPYRKRYSMPVPLSFFLIGFFIWLAENMATFLGAWKYAYQHRDWSMVDTRKIGSWILMSIVSYLIVMELKFLKEKGPVFFENQSNHKV
jgi:uncharacterized membrane protein YoaT (DUF817 family)